MMQHFVKAEEAGRSVKSLEWNQEVGSKLEECLRSSMEAATSQVYDTKKKVNTESVLLLLHCFESFCGSGVWGCE